MHIQPHGDRCFCLIINVLVILFAFAIAGYHLFASESSTFQLSPRGASEQETVTPARSAKATTKSGAFALGPREPFPTQRASVAWIAPLTSSPAELIPPSQAHGPQPPTGHSVRVYVYDRVRKCGVEGLALYGVSPATIGGPFVTNKLGFATVALAKGDEVVELEIMGNYQPLFDEQLRLWPSNTPQRRFRLPTKPTARDTVFLPVVPVVRADVSVYELPYKRMINVPVTLTPLQAVVREPLTLTAGAEDELEGARFAIPAHEGDTYRVSVGENLNTGPKDIGTFTVRAYKEPIELRVNLYAGAPPLEIITTEH